MVLESRTCLEGHLRVASVNLGFNLCMLPYDSRACITALSALCMTRANRYGRATSPFGTTISHMRYEGVYSLNLLYGDAYPSLVTHLESDFLWPNALSKS